MNPEAVTKSEINQNHIKPIQNKDKNIIKQYTQNNIHYDF
jgi:hypothetical protein